MQYCQPATCGDRIQFSRATLVARGNQIRCRATFFPSGPTCLDIVLQRACNDKRRLLSAGHLVEDW